MKQLIKRTIGLEAVHQDLADIRKQLACLAAMQGQLACLETLQQDLAAMQEQFAGMGDKLAKLPEYFAPLDGLPIPPPELRCLVQDIDDLTDFFESGSICSKQVVESLKDHGRDINDFQAILDFGCGCGRTIRHVRSLTKAKLFGSDYNPKLVEWCRHNLSFAQLEVNRLEPPLVYTDETFDLVYAFSVFTHLPEPLQFSWMNELSRVLKTGGYLAMSTLDEDHLDGCPDLQEKVMAGQFFIYKEDVPGSNECCCYYSSSYLKEKLAIGFEVLEYVPCGAHGQSFHLLRKLRHVLRS